MVFFPAVPAQPPLDNPGRTLAVGVLSSLFGSK